MNFVKGSIVVLHDQGGRGNPRFCEVTSVGKKLLTLRELRSKRETRFSSPVDHETSNRPVFGEYEGKAFRISIDKVYDMYDPTREYISVVYY